MWNFGINIGYHIILLTITIRFGFPGFLIFRISFINCSENISNDDSNYDEETVAEPTPHHYEHLVIEGNTYEGDYNDKMLFGMSVPKELWSTNDDLPAAYHEDVDQVNGATLTIEVTFLDDSTETHHYRLSTGKIFVPSDENGYLQWDNLTRFISSEDEPYTYGYLMEKID